ILTKHMEGRQVSPLIPQDEYALFDLSQASDVRIKGLRSTSPEHKTSNLQYTHSLDNGTPASIGTFSLSDQL
ncbi:12429_t:CDS:1, partial [Acaulospora morrowiae]